MYDARMISIRGRQCALRLAPEQPDCMPYYVSAEFGAAVLWCAGGDLRRRAPRLDFIDAMACGLLNGSDYVSEVVIHNVHGFPWTYDADETAADYVITVTHAAWLAGIAPGHRFECYAYCETGAYLNPMKPPDHDVAAWWFAGRDNVRPRDVIRDLDVLEALNRAGIS